MAVNFTKYQDEITKSWRTVVDSTSTPNWALYGYEGPTNVIKLMATGCQGLEELVKEFNCSLIQYAFCRVIDQQLGLNKLVLINWQGDSAPLSRKGLCASHVGDVTNYFKGCTQTITIRNDDEATKEHLMEQIVKTSASKINLSRQQQSSSFITNNDTTNNDSISTSTSSHKKVDISSELAANRKTFWQRQEEEEKERIAEEKKRAAEKQAQFESERKKKEELEAKQLAEKIKERDRLIEANKKAELSSSSQPLSSLAASSADSSADDDGRVGRRSELIRLERNQETQSLISKGLIKNKRAIFEKAQQQQQQETYQPTLTRRSSGAMVTRRMNAFKSLDTNTSSTSFNASTTANNDSARHNSVNKLANSFAEQVSFSGDTVVKTTPVETITREIEPVVLTKEPENISTSNITVVSDETDSNRDESKSNLDESKLTMDQSKSMVDETSSESIVVDSSLVSEPFRAQENGSKNDISQDVNGNSENSFSKKSEHDTSEVITNEELIMNGKNSSIKAIALFDYQAADNTEISFDPDDKIGHIQKVDPGWWHGQVMTGRFKGQAGLFPANYVQEIES